MSIRISRADLIEILNYDPETGDFTWKVQKSNAVKPGDKAGSLNGKGYRYIMIDEYHYNASLLAWFYVYGTWLDRIDHWNGVPGDDRIQNLRPATRGQNRHNAKINKNNRVGSKGVRFRRDNKKWQARIQVDGRSVSLGHFATREQAEAAYAEGAAKFYGSYASTGNYGRKAS